MATVRKRKWTHKGTEKEAWVVEYTDNTGARRRVTVSSKKEADNKRREIEVELNSGQHTAKNASATVKALCDDFMRMQDQRLKDGMIRTEWRRILERVIRLHIVPYLGNKVVSELHARDAEKWWADISATGKQSLATRKSYLEILRRIEAIAIRKEYTKRKVFDDFRPERATSRKVINTLNVDDIKQIIEALKHRPRWLRSRTWAAMKCAVYLSAFCGLRRGEIFGMKAENIDFDARLIRVRNSLTATLELKGPKTRAGVRDVPMPEPVEAVLREWFDGHYSENKLGLLLTTEKNQPHTMGNGFYHAWTLLLVRAGLQDKGDKRPFHFHALRHFAASWMLEGKLSPPDVASLLGHRTFDVTLQVYAHSVFSGSHRHSALDRMAAALVAEPQTITVDATQTRQQHLSA